MIDLDTLKPGQRVATNSKYTLRFLFFKSDMNPFNRYKFKLVDEEGFATFNKEGLWDNNKRHSIVFIYPYTDLDEEWYMEYQIQTLFMGG